VAPAGVEPSGTTDAGGQLDRIEHSNQRIERVLQHLEHFSNRIELSNQRIEQALQSLYVFSKLFSPLFGLRRWLPNKKN